ncbi:3894_t:CDS:2, partial [Cetraspora pellucida]
MTIIRKENINQANISRQPHCLTEFIIVLNEKANKSNKLCICKKCVEGSSYEDAEKNKFANMQELVHHHLKNCIYFQQNYSESEKSEILARPDKSAIVEQWISLTKEEDNEFMEDDLNNLSESKILTDWYKEAIKQFANKAVKQLASKTVNQPTKKAVKQPTKK